ncbi:MAG: agmatine deiminase family protein [Pirellulaceae bacterium]
MNQNSTFDDNDFPATESPAELGYRWPAEWEPQQATWLSWPRNPETWPGAFDAAVEEYAHFAKVVAEFQEVHILAGGDAVMESAAAHMEGIPQVHLHEIPTNDSWIRDHGPIFLTSQDEQIQPALIDWRYNAWGGKYPPFTNDDKVPERIAMAEDRRRFASHLIIEGGAIETNGHGLLMTTSSCVMNPNRNPNVLQSEIEEAFRDFLNIDQILWLGGEIAGDDTDGHIDQLARFVNPHTVVYATDGSLDLEANRSVIEQAETKLGKLTAVPLPMPSPKTFQGMRLPASYANFLLVNGGVLVPAFHDSHDEQAASILREFFPDRRVVSVPSLSLVVGLGSLHCLSQQEPLAVLPNPA